MIDRLAALFRPRDEARPKLGAHGFSDMQLAAAALLVEAAVMDEDFDERERATIRALVERRFALTAEESARLVEAAEAAVHGSGHIYRFTRVVNDSFTPQERVELIEMLWEVVYADGELHDYESNLIRRLGGLVHVSDRDRGRARKRVRERLGLA